MKYFMVFFIAISLVACNNVKDLKFTKDNQEQIMEKVGKSKDLTGEEVGLLMAALMRTTFSGEGIEGKTVGKLIEEQRKIKTDAEMKEKEARKLAEETAKKEAQIVAELTKIIMVAPFKKSFQKADWRNFEYEDKIKIAFVFKNKSKKNIKAFKGEAVFKDLFGEIIEQSNLTFDDGLEAGQEKKWYGSIKYNEFVDSMRKFRDTELENMKFEWKPKAIIFADGSKIGIDN